jgi:hypothetical protein
MPDPSSAYGVVIDSVLASASPTPGTVESAMAQVIMGAAAAAPLAPIVPFDADRPSGKARAAEGASQSEALRVAARDRLEVYIDRFGFDRNEKETIRGRSIREPWLGITASDVEAVLAVERLTGVPAAYVLALWIGEGKEPWNAAFRGRTVSIPWPAADFGKESVRQFRAFARSLVLFSIFGADPLAAFAPRAGAGGDNALMGPEGPHDRAFKAGLAPVREKFPDRMPPNLSDKQIADFFTEPGGALVARHVKAPRNQPDDNVAIQLGKDSLASWLWLQVMLFESVRRTLEQKLFDLYPGEGAVDLSRRPWATYLFWNTNKEQATVIRHYGNSPTRERAISRKFGSEGADPDHLDADQLDRYYSRGAHAPAQGQGQSTAAWANAIMYRFLVETIEPWFASP